MAVPDRRPDFQGSSGHEVTDGPSRRKSHGVMTGRLILAAGLLAWAPIDAGRADTLPETTLPCNVSHTYENETNRTALLTVQVFNGCSGLGQSIEINLFGAGAFETITEVRGGGTRAVSFRVSSGRAVQVRGPGGNGEFRSSFSVVAR